MKLVLTKIISGGQTGADQGALFAAETLGLATGGWMPKGFKTELGANAELAQRFGLIEHSGGYRERTQCNVLVADATLVFGRIASPGSLLTRNSARSYAKPCYTFGWPTPSTFVDPLFLGWLLVQRINVLNVAGNRESTNPGIFNAIQEYLCRNLKEHIA